MMPKPKYDHPVIQKGAVQVFAHLAQMPMSPELKEVSEHGIQVWQNPWDGMTPEWIVGSVTVPSRPLVGGRCGVRSAL